MEKKPAAKVYYNQFMAGFKNYAKLRLFYIFGNDIYLKDRAVDLLRQNFTKPGAQDFDAITLYGDSCQGNEVLEHLETLPFMAPYKFVLLKNFDNLKKNDTMTLEKYCKNPLSSSILVIVAEKADNRTTFMKTVSAQGVLIECKTPYDSNNLLRWLDNELRNRNIIMDQKSRTYFVNNVELSYQAAENELEKLFLFTHGKKTYTLADLETTLGVWKGNDVYDLQRALGKKELKLSQNVLQNMLITEDARNISVMIVSMLTRYFLLLWKIQIYRMRSYSEPEITQNHLSEVFYLFRDEYIKASRNFSYSSIKQIFSLLLKADTDLKSLNLDHTTLFMLIYQICRQ
jgi:DNA polymerase III subunit delta